MDNVDLLIWERQKHHHGQMRAWILKEVCTTHLPPANTTEAHYSVPGQRENTEPFVCVMLSDIFPGAGYFILGSLAKQMP